ncbi:MAG: hypothetical protein N2748_03765, partial [candidate division WOR-3 bacterium]|nr:hypothetical protein [candidate division WOR-3 bacterium]
PFTAEREKSKLFLPKILPLIFVNRIELYDGAIFREGRTIFDSLNLKANLHLRVNGGSLIVDNLAFNFKDRTIKVKMFQGKIDLLDDLLSFKNSKLQLPYSAIDFNLDFNLDKNHLDLEIKKGDISVNDFIKAVVATENNQQGRMQISAKISADLSFEQFNKTKISGSLRYENSNLKIANFLIPNGKGNVNFYDTLIVLNHSSKELTNETQLKINGNFLLKDYSYQGIINFSNYIIPVLNFQFPIDGTINLNGIGTEKLDLSLLGSCKKPEIESIFAKGQLSNGRFTIKGIRVKNRSGILMLDGDCQLTDIENSLDCHYRFTDFELSLASMFYNIITQKEWRLSGNLNGWGHISLKNGQMSSKGKIKIENAGSVAIRIKKLSLEYNLSNINKLLGEINLAVDSINWRNNYISSLDFSLSNEDFSLNVTNWRKNSLAVLGKLVRLNKIQVIVAVSYTHLT